MALITTERLMLRRWQPADRGPYAAMMMDPEVSTWLGSSPERDLVLHSIDRLEAKLEMLGDSFLALERRDDAKFVGTALLRVTHSDLPLAPVHEIGWRLARPAWGHGYATEAAQALLEHGFRSLMLPEIIAFTAEINSRSRAVMERLGMKRDAARDFDNPLLPAGHPLLRHIVYTARPTMNSQ